MPALQRASAEPVGYLDVYSTLQNISTERDRLQRLYEQQPGKNLIAPKWPTLPETFNLDAPPLAPDTRAEVQVALGVARWLEAMAVAWEEIESQRLRRSYMSGDAVGDGSSVRPCPVALADAA
ncbi:hypothetical protein MARA_37530 [Mycolicibacterium arabiense]|uniref:Uncharacterized protein n=2 Tax=Mycolicibacterium arabiense TaxID=1286181 RepID=A0A7I7S2W7_9MYCO|nr:hypothetical protein MARA_37530 [Mycolicibacterium arabiense]